MEGSAGEGEPVGGGVFRIVAQDEGMNRVLDDSVVSRVSGIGHIQCPIGRGITKGIDVGGNLTDTSFRGVGSVAHLRQNTSLDQNRVD